MSVTAPHEELIERAKRRTEEGDYEEAWDDYREFRTSLDTDATDTGTLLVLDEAERAARESFRTGTAGFESDMQTLLYVAARVPLSGAPAGSRR